MILGLLRPLAPWFILGVLIAGTAYWINHQNGVIERKTLALREASAALKLASQAIAERDAAISRQANHERDDANQATAFWKAQVRASFDAGRSTCPRVAGEPDAGGVPDLRDLWTPGATASGALPRVDYQ